MPSNILIMQVGGWFIAAVFLFLAGLLLWRIAAKGTDEFLSLPTKVIVTIILLALLVFAFRASAILALFLVLTCGVFLAVLWMPHIVSVILSPLTTAFTGGNDPIDPKPFYHRAVALRKKGLYDEARADIEAQLAQFEGDFDGLMLLAEVQSDDLKDLPAALATLRQIVSSPGRADREIILALNRLADLQLRLADRDAARRTFEQIVAQWPDTESARFAEQRLAHLPGAEFLAERHAPHIIQFPQADHQPELSDGVATGEPSFENASDQATRLVAQVVQFPDDWEAREKLALLYANHFQRFDLAADQLETLIAQPNQPPKVIVRWLNVLADIHLKRSDNTATTAARETLNRIVKLFPDSAWAANAESRIARLGLEDKAKHEIRTLKLGNYEQNIGLKFKKPLPPTPPPVE